MDTKLPNQSPSIPNRWTNISGPQDDCAYLRMYNARTWDEILPFVQHSYIKALHNSICHNVFKVCLGFEPLALIDVVLPIASSLTKSPPTQA